jgi:hypothetical protein
LEDEWENGLHSAAGRAKEAVKFIIHGHLKAQGGSLICSQITLG